MSLRYFIILTGLVPYLVMLSLWPFYIDYRVVDNVGINPERLLLVWMCVLWGIYLILDNNAQYHLFRVFKKYKFLFITMVIYLALRGVGVIYSENKVYSSFLYVNEIVTNYFLFIMTVSLLRTKDDVFFIVKTLLFCLVAVSVYTVYEYIVKYNILPTFGSIESKATKIALLDKIRGGEYRAQGTFEHPLTLAQYLSFLFPMIMFSKIIKLSIFNIILLAMLFLVSLYATHTRTPFVTLGVVVVLYIYFEIRGVNVGRFYLKMHKRLLQTIVILAVLLFVLFLGMNIIGKEGTEEYSSTMTRVNQIEIGYELTKENFLNGVGIGVSGEAVKEYSNRFEVPLYTDSIDNMYLKLMLESGFPSLVLFVVFIGTIIYYVSKVKENNLIYELDGFYALGLYSLTGFVITMAILAIFTILPLFFVVAGLLLADLCKKTDNMIIGGYE